MNRQQQRQNAKDQKRLQQRQRARQQGGRAAPPSLGGRRPAGGSRLPSVQEARSPGRRLPPWLPWGIAGIVVVALIALFVIIDPLGLRAPLPGAKVPLQGNDHVNPGDSHVAYNTDPPTSGPHFPNPPNPAIYKEPLATEFLPHFMEHGGVIVQYNKDASQDVIDKLKAIYNAELGKVNTPSGGEKLLMAPRPAMPCEVAVTSWGRIETWGNSSCNQPGYVGHEFNPKSSSDVGKLKTFIERNYCQYDPEGFCGNGQKGKTTFTPPGQTPGPGTPTVIAVLNTATPVASPTAPIGPLAPATPAASATAPLGPVAPATPAP